MGGRLLADEMVARSVIAALRRAGFDVLDLKQTGRAGLSDPEVLALAARQRRVVVTHDKDFADPALYVGRKHPGVVLLRFPRPKPEVVAERLLRALESLPARRLRNSVVEVGEGYVRRLGG